MVSQSRRGSGKTIARDLSRVTFTAVCGCVTEKENEEIDQWLGY